MKVRQASQLAGMSHAYLSQLEAGQRNIPSERILAKLSAAYAVSLEDMLKEAGCKEGGLGSVPEERIAWAFDCLRRDPSFLFGPHLNRWQLPIEVQGYLVELYQKVTGRWLLDRFEAGEVLEILAGRDIYHLRLNDLTAELIDNAAKRGEEDPLLAAARDAVIALRCHLRLLYYRQGMPFVEHGRLLKEENLNDNLARVKKEAYREHYHSRVEQWLHLGQEAAKGVKISEQEVDELIEGVREFIEKFKAEEPFQG